MMDNLYVDKLQGSITESVYDKFYTQFTQQLSEINARLSGLQAAEQDYYVTAKYVLDLSKRAYDLFESSEVEERRQLIKLVLSNLRIEGENVLWELNKPFDLIINCSDRNRWRQTLGTLRTFRWSSLRIGFNLTPKPSSQEPTLFHAR